MKKTGLRLLASRSLIGIVIVAGTPRAVSAEPEVVAWGDNGQGQTDVPGGLSHVVAIAGGWSHSLALTTEGRLVAWGKY